jgi:cystathionine beta-lyase
MEFHPDLAPETILAHLGEGETPHGAVVPPIYQNSLFRFDDVTELAEALAGRIDTDAHIYSRSSNPTLDIVENKLSLLEGTGGCVLTGTGMAAMTIGAMSALEAGGHVVAVDTVYGPLQSLLGNYLKRFGVAVTFVDGASTEEVLDAIRPETKLICLESPGSIVFRMQDLEAISREAKSRGIVTMTDNTYATPLYQQPAKFGVDIIIHSATKYLGGHSDLTAGVLCASADRIKRIRRQELDLFGSVLAPFPAWLLNRGLRTLNLRLKRHGETGNQIAAWMEGLPSVERVIHVGLPSFPQKELFQKQMSGSGGLFTFIPKCQEKERVYAFANALKLFGCGVSWGGHESLAIPLQIKTLAYGGPTWMVRLYCGLEAPKDLIADLEQAFATSGL